MGASRLEQDQVGRTSPGSGETTLIKGSLDAD